MVVVPPADALTGRDTESVPAHRLRYRIIICVDDDNARLYFFMPGTMLSRQVGAGFVRSET
jgi:hypothetical protein